jgi:hypothetical protein
MNARVVFFLGVVKVEDRHMQKLKALVYQIFPLL